MLEVWAEALQATALSRTLRASIWLYPLVNTGHVLGIALLFGGIAPLDLRLLGCFRFAPLEPLARVLIPMALSGLLLAAATGALLFATRPVDYVAEPLFAIKLGLLVAAVVNAAMLRRLPEWALLRVWVEGRDAFPMRWKVAALASLLLWLGVIIAGRLIGYR